jgi:hypothetical protein
VSTEQKTDVWDADDQAFFDKALLSIAPAIWVHEKTGTADFLMKHAAHMAEMMTDERRAVLARRGQS